MTAEPLEYERVAAELIRQLTGLKGLHIDGRRTLPGRETSHEVDASFRFSLGGMQFLVVVECKSWSHPVEKRHVQAFLHTIRDLGAHKGIFVTSSAFQRGAIRVAQAHGIALLVVRHSRLVQAVLWSSPTPVMRLEDETATRGLALQSTLLAEDVALEFAPADSYANDNAHYVPRLAGSFPLLHYVIARLIFPTVKELSWFERHA